jgi:hypothetical protein
VSFALWVSGLAFIAIETYVLQDQLLIGHASGLFMFGTACLVAAASIALFALLVATCAVFSAALASDRPAQEFDEQLDRQPDGQLDGQSHGARLTEPARTARIWPLLRQDNAPPFRRRASGTAKGSAGPPVSDSQKVGSL